MKDDYDSDIPPTLKELVKLPGIGPKMAHIIMDVGWKQVTGIKKGLRFKGIIMHSIYM